MIGFPLVTQFGGGLSFKNNPQLEMLKFPLLEKMDAEDGLFYYGKTLQGIVQALSWLKIIQS